MSDTPEPWLNPISGEHARVCHEVRTLIDRQRAVEYEPALDYLIHQASGALYRSMDIDGDFPRYPPKLPIGLSHNAWWQGP